MKLTVRTRILGLSIAVAFLWALAGSIGANLNPWQWFLGTPRAAPPDDRAAANPCNPCNPNARKAANPCNPCNPGAAAQASNPCNPCNPGAAGNPDNPCNPCNPNARAAANPCNPCNPDAAAAASNPCNPCNPGGAAAATNPCNPSNPGGAAPAASNPCNPDRGQAANPCNPGSAVQAGMTSDGGKIGWGRDFKSWDAVTGYVISNSHGNRLVQTYIYPPEAARVYKHNAELARLRKQEGYQLYPPGTQIVQESWLRNDLGGPGRAGPVFFMRKESAGGGWHYGFTRDDLTLVGEGDEGSDSKMAFCAECHARAERRDNVFATER